MSAAYRSDLVDVEVYRHHETDRAYKVSTSGDADDATWVPKAQCELAKRPGTTRATLTLPRPLAIEKELLT